MGDSVILFLGTVVAIEIAGALRLMRAFATLARIAHRSNRLLLRRGVSEWAKERAMRLMAIKLFVQSVRSALLLGLVGLPIGLSFAVAATPAGWAGRGGLLAATLGYSLVRRRIRIDRAGADRLLHRLTLGTAPVRDISFDIERAAYRRRLPRDAGGEPIFVAGLARAGTTILLRALHDSGDFASLSYRDLPFPLAPNCWARIASRSARKVAATERGHGDGILHDLDSPEAIEEVFWGHFEGERFRLPYGLTPTPVAPATVAAFRDYVGLVRLRYGGGRYLSKNNNNVLRLPALVGAFPDALLVHPFRDPLQQAASLRQQHVRACALAAEDPFRRDFMTWLGHHEFGGDRRPFLIETPTATTDSTTIDHWLAQWIGAYRFLLDQPAQIIRRQIFVDYDWFCMEPERSAPMLAERLGLGEGFNLASLRPSPSHAIGAVDNALVIEAYMVHAALVERSETFGAAEVRRAIAFGTSAGAKVVK
jgi:hypothetical protein